MNRGACSFWHPPFLCSSIPAGLPQALFFNAAGARPQTWGPLKLEVRYTLSQFIFQFSNAQQGFQYTLVYFPQ
jgi:hypothetical protein